MAVKAQGELLKVPSTKQKPKVLIAYFSYTGITRRVAEFLTERLRRLCDVEVAEIVPTRKRSYIHWLAYSFLPGSEVEIQNAPLDVTGYDAVLLGFPKWTFSCPPLNRFIRQLKSVRGTRFFLFMTCGGFDENRFLLSICHKLNARDCDIRESVAVGRKLVLDGSFGPSVGLFITRIDEQLKSSPSQC